MQGWLGIPGLDAAVDGAAVVYSAALGRFVVQPAFILPSVDLADAATIITDAALSSNFAVTIAGDRTMAAPLNPRHGQRLTYEITQGSGGSHLIAWATGAGGFAFGDDVVEPVLSTVAGKVDYIVHQYNGLAARWRCLAYARGY